MGTVRPDGVSRLRPERPPSEAETGASAGKTLQEQFEEFCDPERTPCRKRHVLLGTLQTGVLLRQERERASVERREKEPFEAAQYLGFDPDETDDRLSHAQSITSDLENLVDERTVNVAEELDEDAFFSDRYGNTTVVNRYDLEKSVPLEKKTHFVEENRYWVNKPYACVIIFHPEKKMSANTTLSNRTSTTSRTN